MVLTWCWALERKRLVIDIPHLLVYVAIGNNHVSKSYNVFCTEKMLFSCACRLVLSCQIDGAKCFEHETMLSSDGAGLSFSSMALAGGMSVWGVWR